MSRKIFGVGETVLDVIFRNDKPIAAVPGGSAFNAIISLGRSVGREFADIPIQMITETGDDLIGDIVMDFLRENNISIESVTRNEGTQTHISMAFLNDKSDAQYEFYKDHAHARLNSKKVENIDFAKDDILLFGSFFAINPVLRDYTKALFKKAESAGAILYYDINFRKVHVKDIPDTIDNIIENFKMSTVVRGSAEDFLYLFGTNEPQEVYDRHLRDHCQLFICTDGNRPITLITPKFSAKYEVEQVDAVSTIGAGDNFNAGFVYGLIKDGITKGTLLRAEKDVWDKLICSGQTFSKEVCQSIFNYID